MKTREITAAEICMCAHRLDRHYGLLCNDCEKHEKYHEFQKTFFVPKNGMFIEIFDEEDIPRETKVKGGR